MGRLENLMLKVGDRQLNSMESLRIAHLVDRAIDELGEAGELIHGSRLEALEAGRGGVELAQECGFHTSREVDAVVRGVLTSGRQRYVLAPCFALAAFDVTLSASSRAELLIAAAVEAKQGPVPDPNDPDADARQT